MRKSILTLALSLNIFALSASAQEASTYKNNYDLRSQRKMGIGATIGGALGVAGLIAELNIEKENGVVSGLGAGPGYNSFLLSWKRTFEGSYVTPYTLLGYSHWFGSGTQGDVGQSAILSQVLTDSEKSSGTFGKNFVAGSLGIQYNHLQGELAGLSFMFQFDAMESLENNSLLLSGGIATVYYF